MGLGRAPGPGVLEAVTRTPEPGRPWAGAGRNGQCLRWESGTRRALWPPSSFGGARPRAPKAAQPRGRTNGGWQTWNQSAPRIRIAGVVRRRGRLQTQAYSFPPTVPQGLRDWRCSPDQAERLAVGSCVSLLRGRRRWPGRVGRGPWGPGAPPPPRLPPTAPPSLSAFAPSPGWTGADLPQTYGSAPGL